MSSPVVDDRSAHPPQRRPDAIINYIYLDLQQLTSHDTFFVTGKTTDRKHSTYGVGMGAAFASNGLHFGLHETHGVFGVF